MFSAGFFFFSFSWGIVHPEWDEGFLSDLQQLNESVISSESLIKLTNRVQVCDYCVLHNKPGLVFTKRHDDTRQHYHLSCQ